MTREPCLLLVEDDAPLRHTLRLQLRDEGFEVVDAATGRAALDHLDAGPAAVLLDLGLPDVDGLDLCTVIRSVTGVPVVVISGRNAPQDVSASLAAGADDYVAKPFLAAELARRVRQLLLPVCHPLPPTPVERLERLLTHTELRVLCELAVEPGRVVGCGDLLRSVWGLSTDGQSDARVAARIESLRDKLSTVPGSPDVVAAGGGYQLQS